MNQDQLEQQDMQLRKEQLQVDQAKLGQSQQEMNQIVMQEQEQQQQSGMIKEQLDSSNDIEKIYHLLKGYSLEKNVHGIFEWVEPENNDMIVLSKEGIKFVMEKILTYLTKNTLLSNYDETTINEKMEDLGNSINDTIFMNSDLFFLKPTLEDCKGEIKLRIKKKVDIQKFASELLGKDINEEAIEKEIKKEMEETIERELEVIRQQKMKAKYKMFESIIMDILNPIHSAYQRAWKGEERTTLRKHTNITENRGMPMIQPQPANAFNPFGIFKRT